MEQLVRVGGPHIFGPLEPERLEQEIPDQFQRVGPEDVRPGECSQMVQPVIVDVIASLGEVVPEKKQGNLQCHSKEWFLKHKNIKIYMNGGGGGFCYGGWNFWYFLIKRNHYHSMTKKPSQIKTWVTKSNCFILGNSGQLSSDCLIWTKNKKKLNCFMWINRNTTTFAEMSQEQYSYSRESQKLPLMHINSRHLIPCIFKQIIERRIYSTKLTYLTKSETHVHKYIKNNNT